MACRAAAISPAQPCLRQQQRRSRRPWRTRRAAVVRAGELPAVNWTRSGVQQCLFIDRTDTVRARFAVGLLERIVSWRGCSRIIVGYPCGLEAAAGSRIPFASQAALFGLAGGWQLRPHLFTAERQQFEADDIDRFELLVCLDSAVQAEVLKQLSAARPDHPASYVSRICCLTDFLLYCSDDALLRAGSASLLDRQLRNHVALALPQLRPSAAKVSAAAAAAAEAGASIHGSLGGSAGSGSDAGEAYIPAYMLPAAIPRPPLDSGVADQRRGGDGCGSAGCDASGASVDEQWERMALLTTLCCAGLVQYLLDCRPPDDPNEE